MSAKHHTAEDLTGRSRLGRNVTFAWGGYMVNIAAGFIMPRLISDRLGQTTLGIWDFSWGIVTYFSLVQLNLGSSINRYVAAHRTAKDRDGLCRSVSTVGLALNISAALAALLTLAAFFWIVPLFASRLGSELSTARWVVLCLGFEIAIGLLFTVYGGVLAGCHRWDIHNTVSVITYAVMAVGMIATLLGGGGLVAVALVHCLSTSGGEVARMFLAKRVCPELRINYRQATWTTFLEQARFSAKSLIPRLAEMVSGQSLVYLLTLYFGPAMLAVYSRSQNLVRQGSTLAAKFGFILVPTASSMHSASDHASLRQTFRDSVRQIALLGMPMSVTLGVAGDYVIRLWMGAAYVYPGLMTIMAIAAFPAWVQEPIWSILTGMNQHGRVAWAKFVAACVAALTLIVAVTMFGAGLRGAAIAFLLPQLIVDVAITPALACRRIGLSVRSYYADVLLKPFLCSLPYGILLFLTTQTFGEHLNLAIMLGLSSLLALAGIYWFFVFPPALRYGLRAKLGLALT